jgi:muramoyltetrapeptide carboxypeptidase
MDLSIIPPRLQPGDQIGIISPSSSIPDKALAQFRKGLNFLSDLGFIPVIGKHVCSRSLGYAASPEEKLEDLHGFFADSSIKALICTQGGDTANACLSDLNWDLIKANPKIFMGLSDNTVLLNALFHRTGLITFHGPDLFWGLGKNPTAYDRQEFISRLMEGKIGAIPPNRERRTIRGGTAEGRLLGGNLRCLLKLAGTPYFPDFSGAIFFMEALSMTPEKCDYLFRQLIQMGVFDRISGAVVGYIDGLQRGGKEGLQMEDVLLRLTPSHRFPILKINDFGHNCPNTILPVGGRVRLDGDHKEIEILEPCIS